MLLVSDRQLLLHDALHAPGHPFEEHDEDVAMELIRRGVVRKHGPPRILYEYCGGKVIYMDPEYEENLKRTDTSP